MNSNETNTSAPLILVTNDDGIDSPGLLAAVEAARRLGTVIVAAPTTQQTARGRGMTGNRDDHFHPLELPLEAAPDEHLHPVEAWHIDASPALTVRHALAVLCPERPPDLVIAGINYGENLGTNITISGTVGAAMQAASQGIPALALSRQTEIHHHYEYGELDWTDARRVTGRWTGLALERIAASPGRMPFALLKIDIPDPCPPGTEERITRLSRQPYFRSRIENPSRSMPIRESRTSIEVNRAELHREDDIYALALDRVVSITPLQLDCTAPAEDLRADQA
ncbi:MAG: 5'/3'-nucleotidase SurE [Spirochaetaceae bacterium]|nr:MAG: 5'/3'-nucleotidase SurE [Spirochaetaceae bacterium]